MTNIYQSLNFPFHDPFYSNKLFEVTSAGVKPIPSLVEDRINVSECTPFLAGMKYCTTLQYSDASSHDTAPYFPFTGDSK